MDKISALRDILALDPNSSFARYGLAMELAGKGLTTAAMDEFDTLLANNPDYTPAYFMAAQTLAGMGRKEAAIARLQGGIKSAERSGNRHALNEMQAMIDDLER